MMLFVCFSLYKGIGVTVSVAYGLYMIGSSVFRCWIIEFIIYAVRDPIPWSHCNNEWNTPFCKDNTAFVTIETNGSNPLSSSSPNTSTYTNNTSVYTDQTSVGNVTMTTTVSDISGTPMTAAEEFWQ